MIRITEEMIKKRRSSANDGDLKQEELEDVDRTLENFMVDGSPSQHEVEDRLSALILKSDAREQKKKHGDESSDANKGSSTFDSDTNTAHDGQTRTNGSIATIERSRVSKVTRLASTLTKELSLSGMTSDLSNIGRNTASRGKRIRVFIECIKQKNPNSFLSLEIHGFCTVHDVINLILEQYTEEQRSPPLQLAGAADLYELRIVDEDDGSIEEDFPPLDKNGDILSFNIDACALCRAPGVNKEDIVLTETCTRFPKLDTLSKNHLRVFLFQRLVTDSFRLSWTTNLMFCPLFQE